MTSVDTGNLRMAASPRRAARARLTERLVLATTSIALIFALAIAFGFISG